MDAKELVELLTYNRDRLIDERGADYSGVRALNTAIEMVIEASEQTRWIPVSERLPKKNDVYLVTMKDHEVYELSFSNERWFVQGNDEIVAWMPLPQPYKAETEEV